MCHMYQAPPRASHSSEQEATAACKIMPSITNQLYNNIATELTLKCKRSLGVWHFLAHGGTQLGGGGVVSQASVASANERL